MEHDIDMAPPNKRRRLSGESSQSLPSHSDFIPEGPSPTLPHSIEDLDQKPTSIAARTVPKHIEEIHFQIQERGVAEGLKGLHRVYPRQGATAVIESVTSIDAAGQTIVAEVTIGATTTTPSTASVVPEASGSSSNSTSSSTDLTDSTDSIGSAGTATALTSSNSTSTDTETSTKHTMSETSNHKTLPAGVFVATLTDGDRVTVTRLDHPFKTTFADGETSTICDKTGQCKLSGDDEKTQTQQSPDEQSPSSSAPSVVTSTAYAAGSQAGQTTTSSASSSASAEVQHHDSDNSTPPPGTIAGGVVGGAAGLAVILLLAMIMLRWYKRRRQLGHHALPPSSTFTPDPDTPSSRGPGMAERAGIRPLANVVPGFFRHHNRSEIEPPPSERSFQKVSGRKLPSAFSEGMSSSDMSGPGPNVPLNPGERNLSSLSFYRDSQGFYGGEGDGIDRAASPDDVPPLHSAGGGMTLSPGPGRRPTVHTGGPYVMSPSSSVPSTPGIHSPNLATIPGSPPDHPGKFNRSSTPSTVPDNRSSRFTEEV